MDNEYILELQHITKEFPGVKALSDVNFNLKKGEVHALIGENGAGKSTLIKILAGVYTATEGEIVFEGKKYDSLTPKQAKDIGIGIMHQELNLVNELSVMENMFLGRYPKKGGVILDRQAMREKAREILKTLDIDLDPDTLVRDLTVGYQQMVELARAILENAKILILDEPTAPLTDKEVNTLFEFIERAKRQGISIIYISHRLEEIFQITDRITVLRDGEYISTLNTADTNRDELTKLMVGRDVKNIYVRHKPIEDQSVILDVRHVSGNGVSDISFSLKRGEILGFAGLIGAGRTEFAGLLYGVHKIDSGEILYKGEPYVPKAPGRSIENGIAFVPEDRKQQGLLLEMSVRENTSMSVLRKLSRGMVVNRRKERELVGEYKEKMNIKTASYEQKVKNLSGGNQQKVVLAKALAIAPEIVIIDEPTRGIDVGARQEIYQLMNEIVEQGKAVIMISSDMEELLGMSDRVIVFCEGQVRGELNREEFAAEQVLKYASMTGNKEESA